MQGCQLWGILRWDASGGDDCKEGGRMNILIIISSLFAIIYKHVPISTELNCRGQGNYLINYILIADILGLQFLISLKFNECINL